MDNRADGGAVAVVIGLVLILLLLGLGGGVYFVWSRQQLAMQAQRAVAAEAEARMQLERARAEAEAAAAAAKTSRINDSAVAGEGSIENAVKSVLRTQQDAWNRGDIDAFMDHYWKDEALTFSSEGKTTRGWEATLTRYKERYPTKEKMGRLELTDPEITPVGDCAAYVLGKWQIERDGGPLSGNFTLILRQSENRWLIVHDHTSRASD